MKAWVVIYVFVLGGMAALGGWTVGTMVSDPRQAGWLGAGVGWLLCGVAAEIWWFGHKKPQLDLVGPKEGA